VPIPCVEGETPISIVPLPARTPSAESAGALSKGPSDGSSRTRAGKRRAAATPPATQKERKVTSKKTPRIKINDPAPNPPPALIPPSRT
jgi:hypothetical protein